MRCAGGGGLGFRVLWPAGDDGAAMGSRCIVLVGSDDSGFRKKLVLTIALQSGRHV